MISNMRAACRRLPLLHNSFIEPRVLLQCVPKQSLVQTSAKRGIITINKIRQMYQDFWRPPAPKPPYTHICQLGDPVLRAKASPVKPEEIKTKKFQELISKMKKSMKNYEACGLSAQQLGVPARVIAMHFTEDMLKNFDQKTIEAREMKPFPMKIFINPVMKVTEANKVKFPEGCESIRGYTAVVPRFHAVKLTGLDEAGKPVEWEAKGWAARIVQHEMDHLDARVYTDIMDKETFSFNYWHNINVRSGRFNLTFTPYKIFY